MASIKDMKKVTNPKAAYLTHEEVGEIIKNQQKAKKQNLTVAGVYGHDGTAKSGIGLEVCTQDDIDCGRKLFVMDFDKGVSPLLNEYYTVDGVRDPNIILLDPTVRFTEGEGRGGVDWHATIKMCMSMLFYVDELGQEGIAGTIMDGMDTWLKNCEYHMRENELEQKKISDNVSHKNWYIRDKPYNQALMLAKSLPCPTIFITHMKDVMNGSYEDGSLVVIDQVPEWGKLTPGQMYQRVECTTVEKQGKTTFYAEVKKAKGKLYLEGKKHKVAEVKSEDDYKWYGFNYPIS